MFRPSVDHEAVDAYLQVCRDQLFDATRYLLIEADIGVVTMTVSNPSSRILDQVQLTLKVETPDFSGFEHNDTDDLEPLPEPPEPPKATSLVDYGFLAATTPEFLSRVSSPHYTYQLPDAGD